MRRAAARAVVVALAAVTCTPAVGSPPTRSATPVMAIASGARADLPPPAPTPVATPPAPPLVALPAGLDLSAPSASVLWAMANAHYLFVSEDRGATWERRAVPTTDLESGLSFISDRDGWLTTAADTTTVLWHTSDGARSWTAVRSLTTRPGELLFSLAFVDDLLGFVVGRQGPTWTLYRTTDGGAQWTAVLSLQPGVAGIGRAKAVSGGLLLPAGAQVYASRDSGSTWRSIATAPATTWMDLSIGSATRWATGPLSLETDDAGRSWHPWAQTYSQAAGVAPAMLFASADVVYVWVRGTIQRSDDNGVHWTQVLTPGT